MAGSTIHPDGDRFIFAGYADGVGVDVGASPLGRLILVQGFEEELRRMVPRG